MGRYSGEKVSSLYFSVLSGSDFTVTDAAPVSIYRRRIGVLHPEGNNSIYRFPAGR